MCFFKILFQIYFPFAVKMSLEAFCTILEHGCEDYTAIRALILIKFFHLNFDKPCLHGARGHCHAETRFWVLASVQGNCNATAHKDLLYNCELS